MEIADNRDIAGAQKVVHDALEELRLSSSFRARNPTVIALAEDLRDNLEGALSDAVTFGGGGRAEMTECWSKSSAQRSMYTKRGKSAAYQSPSSITFQTRASASKGSMPG